MEIRTLKIRAIENADLNAVSGLLNDLTEKYIAVDCSAEGRLNLLQLTSPAAIEAKLEASFEYHVAEVEGVITGVIAIREHKHLYQLFVAEAWQRQGVARRLWEFALQRALWHGNPGEFTVNSSLYARPVYRKLGFVESSEEKSDRGVVYQPMKLVLNSLKAKKT